MDTLPHTSSPQGIPPIPVTSPPPVAGSMAKEVAPIMSGTPEAPTIIEVGKDVELPQEVTKAGVRMSSDPVILPKLVQQMGVRSVDPVALEAVPSPVINLPISDEQIAKGLHQSIMTSWRWLAQWCTRQLQQAHFTLKSMSGKTVRIHE
ncbi:MAG: hypothetical protein AAB542_01320 [Patescibacteria group bacterium]|mgnify:CR=1 FL=1